MDTVFEILNDALIDTLKLLPFLFFTYLVMEALEHKVGERVERAIRKADVAGPAIGAIFGAFPQCGFSAAASTLFAARVITLGTLFAVFLSTSDEMLPIFIAEQADPIIVAKIIGFKVLVGMLMGFSIDLVARALSRKNDGQMHIRELCEQERCNCEDGILKSAVLHTFQVALFIFLVTVFIGAIIEMVGPDSFAGFIESQPGLSVFAAALVGLIPNCAASVIITELYIEGTLGAGAMMAGLLVSAGIGLLVLFRTNRPIWSNLLIALALFVIGLVWGLVIQGLGITF